MDSVLLTLRRRPMSQLSRSIEAKPKLIVTKGCVQVEPLLGCYTDFKFVLCPRISYDLPVVVSVHEGSVCDHGPEQVV
jgi:hypothetical protein